MVPVMAAFALACGGDDGGSGPEPAPTYEAVAGTYVGAVSATNQGYLLQGNFSISLTQSEGTLGGSYSQTGTVSNVLGSSAAAGAGSLAGTIASGIDPSVHITATDPTCPNVPVTLSGTYISANQTISFPDVTIPIVDETCQVVFTFPHITAVLNK